MNQSFPKSSINFSREYQLDIWRLGGFYVILQ